MAKNNKAIISIILIVLGILFVLSIKTTTTFSILPSCGNGICESIKGENYSTCNLDCGICGNNICEYNKFPPEHWDNCQTDCHFGNGVCDYNENCGNSEDCKCSSTQTCTDNQCKEIVIIPPVEPEKSFFEQELFKVGNVSVTGLMIVILLGMIVLAAFGFGK
jgi:hypothetical protein